MEADFSLSRKVGYLSAVEVFKDLTPDEMEWLGRVTTEVTCEKGRIIYTPGESGQVLYLLKKGAVDLYRLSPEGKKLVTAHLRAGTFFGEMSVLGQGMYDSFAGAAEPAVLCAMSQVDVERLLLTKPIVALRLLQVIGGRLLDAQTALEDLAFKKVSARIAALLLRLAAQQDGVTVAGLTHQDPGGDGRDLPGDGHPGAE